MIKKTSEKYVIRLANSDDKEQIWSIFKPIIRSGETYAIKRDADQAYALNYWIKSGHKCYVIEDDKKIVGSYYICANQDGGGDHICNCGFIVRSKVNGKGYGRAMLNHSLDLAKKLGFKGMQFNFVVSSNKNAINLWKNTGFKIIGRIPLAFNHPTYGLIDALVMFKNLGKD